MTEFLTSVDIGKVDFDCRHASGADGVPQGNARMGVSGGVLDDDIKLPSGFLDPSDEFPFQVGLPEFDLNAQLQSALPDPTLYVLKGGGPINLGFTGPQQIQVWAIKE